MHLHIHAPPEVTMEFFILTLVKMKKLLKSIAVGNKNVFEYISKPLHLESKYST